MFATKFAAAARTAAASMILALAATAAWPSSVYALLTGSVSASSEMSAPIVVMAVDRVTGKVVQRVFLDKNRSFHMPLVPGDYRFYAFADTNRDGLRESGESVSVAYKLSTPLRAGEQLELPVLNIQR